MGRDSIEGTWWGSRNEAEMWIRNMEMRKTTYLPGGILATLLWVLASSGECSWGEWSLLKGEEEPPSR
jgi:hypothetical protein